MTSESPLDNLDFTAEREVRFAVVMYGGVSLAIYINGVVQELLNMVRATAPRTADVASPGTNRKPLLRNGELSGSEVVYRKLGQYLERDRKMLEWIDKPAGATSESSFFTRQARELSDNPILTRFVVDVISGTSAGGINGVFLAKALARNQKMDGLKDLWLKEGDLSKLLNDSESVADLSEHGFAVEEPQRSLLNSQRMYRKLLEALEQMAEKQPDRETSPLVGELDLFITTTDIQGIPLPIILADDVIYERRYRNVYHFRYAPVFTTSNAPNTSKKGGSPKSASQTRGRDDFKMADDPFLAFAARCTSSFPFAFDAMCLRDIEAVLKRYPRYKEQDPSGPSADPNGRARWDHFFNEYLRNGLFDLDTKARTRQAPGFPADALKNMGGATGALRNAFRDRAFGDGGYLDNKPFSYATSMLMRRHSTCVVDRKLLYVEPTPEHPELIPHDPQRPDFAENVRKAVLDLPRQENIREDIERLYDRNEMLRRIGTFATHVDNDVTLIDQKKPALGHEGFEKADLREMINLYGVSYGAYHRLKVEEITRMLAEVIARAAGHDPDSDAAVAIYEIVVAWRKENYREIKKDGKKTENSFLLEFDIRYCLRRLMFLSRRVNQLARIEKPGELNLQARELLIAWLKHLIESRKSESDKALLPEVMKKVDLKEAETLSQRLTSLSESTEAPAFSDDWLKLFREELNDIKRSLGDAAIGARQAEETLWEPGSDAASKLREAIDNLKLPWSDLEPVLSDNDEVKSKALQQIFANNSPTSWESVAAVFRETLSDRSFASVKLFEATDTNPNEPKAAARLVLDHYCRNFVLYDLVTYPVQYGTGAGEANVVEIFRVSPEDATSLIDERKTGEDRRKLAGSSLMSFGAFLDRRWRKNDMLWGRLDGAERLITALLPNESDKQARQDLINEAHIAILKEEINLEDISTTCRLISQALAHSEPTSDQARKLRTFVEVLLAGKDLSAEMNSALRQCLKDPEAVWAYYKKDFVVDRNLDAEHAVRLISRVTTITGKMLGGLADKYRSDPGKRVAAWITRLGTVFWNMIAVAVPQSLGNLFFRHWLGLLYVFSVVIIFAGIIFKTEGVLGWQLLGATIALNLVTSLLGDFIAGDRRWLRLFRAVLIVTVVALMGCGMYFLAQHSTDLLRRHDLLLASLVAGIVLGLLGVAEWRRWLKSFLAAPTSSFSYPRLFWLTGFTLLLGGILGWIGPPHMVVLEFAGTPGEATGFVDSAERVSQLRRQLAIDYLFIVAYSAMLASFCAAAAKLFWERRVIRLQQFQGQKARVRSAPNLKQSDECAEIEQQLPRFSRVFYRIVVIGFILAALQAVAGLADAIENAGLLWFLNECERIPPTTQSEINVQTALTISFWSATLKFALIAGGALYSLIGFATGALMVDPRTPASSKARPWLLGALAVISLLVLLFALRPLWCFALNHPDACVCAEFRPK